MMRVGLYRDFQVAGSDTVPLPLSGTVGNVDWNSKIHAFLDPSVTSAKLRQHVKVGDKPRSLKEQLLKFGG